MGWFSPIKGHYPSLGQIDKTLPVASGDSNKNIVRGSIIKLVTDAVNADGAFELATATTATNVSLLYISLQDYSDSQAGMAGTVGFDGNVPSITEGIITIPGATAGQPTITGLSLSMEGEYETDNYKFETTDVLAVGDALAVGAGGKIVKQSGSAEVIGYLTAKPYTRWVNNATAKSNSKEVVRQGANVSVIRFRTK